ncbi:patatin-like phospholipase domain-containing protein 4 [Diadema antillarum]|uniref:patatin-like phospholipase domain-containing protein 4 n=1 Tax=Diadema antillarum TaxID=105358 RepID=UPI003A872DE7
MERGLYRLCFSGNSFLGLYDIGTAVCILDHGKRVVNEVASYGGVSAGVIAAAIMVSAPERLLQYFEAVTSLSTRIHSLPQGAMTPGFDLMQELRHILHTILKEDCHRVCSNRLHVPLQELVTTDDIPVYMRRRDETLEQELQPLRPPVKTDIVRLAGKDFKFGQKHVVTEFSTKAALIETLVAAVFYPSLPTSTPPQIMGKYYIDVTALSGTPRDGADCAFPPAGHVIMVAPNKAAGYAKTPDNLTLGLRDISRENHQAQPQHMFRLGDGLYPPRKEELQKRFLDGVQEAKEFLKKFRMYDEGHDSFPHKSTIY